LTVRNYLFLKGLWIFEKRRCDPTDDNAQFKYNLPVFHPKLKSSQWA